MGVGEEKEEIKKEEKRTRVVGRGYGKKKKLEKAKPKRREELELGKKEEEGKK